MVEGGEKPMVGDYPAKDLPVIFADTVLTASWQGGVVKFYLIRQDPSIPAGPTSSTQLVAQIVMPIGGFASAVVFFDEQLKKMADGGQLKPEAIEELRATYRRRQADKDAASS